MDQLETEKIHKQSFFLDLQINRSRSLERVRSAEKNWVFVSCKCFSFFTLNLLYATGSILSIASKSSRSQISSVITIYSNGSHNESLCIQTNLDLVDSCL